MRRPTPVEIRATRLAAGLSQPAAAALVHRTGRMWSMWETSPDHQIDLACWELFNIKVERERAASTVERAHVEFNPDRSLPREKALEGIRRTIKDAVRQNRPRTFNQEQLTLMLMELVKNTFDHSTGTGILDMQLPGVDRPLVVTYKDTGEAFDWKTETGVSSKAGNGVNMGLGLSFVRQSASDGGFEVMVARLSDATEFRIAQAA
jgi:anti-sigma regulatory factor (Ser/Thr protein kinase)